MRREVDRLTPDRVAAVREMVARIELRREAMTEVGRMLDAVQRSLSSAVMASCSCEGAGERHNLQGQVVTLEAVLAALERNDASRAARLLKEYALLLESA